LRGWKPRSKKFQEKLDSTCALYYFEEVDNVPYPAAIMVRLCVGSRRAVKSGWFGAVARITGGGMTVGCLVVGLNRFGYEVLMGLNWSN
jgi:hypothetical protein